MYYFFFALAALYVIPSTAPNIPERTNASITGFAAGFVTAFVCFSLLPSSFEQSGVLFTLIFLLTGVFTSNILYPRPAKILWLCCYLAAIIFSFVYPANTALCAVLSFVSGVLLIGSCDKIVPDAHQEFASAAATLGFILGVLFL